MSDLIFLVIISSFAGYFLEFCFEEGNIFGWWVKLINKWPMWISKPLGGCLICTNFWFALVQGYLLGLTTPVYVLLFAMSSSGLLLIFKRIEQLYYVE
jgi:hypothetical protein